MRHAGTGALFATAVVLALVAAGPAVGQVKNGVSDVSPATALPGSISFEPPIYFSQTLPLYLYQNVDTNMVFVAGNGAVLDVFSFAVSGHSAPNALAWNCAATNYDGSVPALPAGIYFPTPVSSFECIVGTHPDDAGETALILAYGAGGTVVDYDFVTLSPSMQPLSVSGSGIIYVHVIGPCIMVMDDLSAQ